MRATTYDIPISWFKIQVGVRTIADCIAIHDFLFFESHRSQDRSAVISSLSQLRNCGRKIRFTVNLMSFSLALSFFIRFDKLCVMFFYGKYRKDRFFLSVANDHFESNGFQFEATKKKKWKKKRNNKLNLSVGGAKMWNYLNWWHFFFGCRHWCDEIYRNPIFLRCAFFFKCSSFVNKEPTFENPNEFFTRIFFCKYSMTLTEIKFLSDNTKWLTQNCSLSFKKIHCRKKLPQIMIESYLIFCVALFVTFRVT